MEIYLIRHTTPLIAKGLIYGRTEVPLAESFLKEQEVILRQIPHSFDAIYSSPSIRCVTLARSISPVYQIDSALCEMDFGDWEGETWDTINREDSEIWMNDFVNLAPPNGENMLTVQDRVLKFWNRITTFSYEHVAIITHGGVIRIILANNHKLELKDAFKIKIRFAEVFRLTVSNG